MNQNERRQVRRINRHLLRVADDLHQILGALNCDLDCGSVEWPDVIAMIQQCKIGLVLANDLAENSSNEMAVASLDSGHYGTDWPP